jgi:hypothetical protein
MASPRHQGDLWIHQAVHGYGHGHDLLAASDDFDDEIANILAHNSDSAPNARVSDGPYLTGYVLPDGRYVIARTWNEREAERPNTVLTLSLLLPAGTPPGFSVERVLDLLQRPAPGPENGRLMPIPVQAAIGPELHLTPDEATVAARYYRYSVPLTHADSRSRERIALAIWTQLWRSARYSLQFCTAPDTDRFSRRDRVLRFETSDRDLDVVDLESRRSTDVIVTDLRLPGPFREFLQFVGSGEKAVGLVESFAEAFLVLTDVTPSVDALNEFLVGTRAVEPRRLRRLKRRFLSFVRDEPRWAVNEFDLLADLAAGPLGAAVYASDASLDQWIRHCWDRDPLRTGELLLRTGFDTGPHPEGPPTAIEGIATAFASQASDLITPTTLGIAVALNRDAATAAIWERNEPGLWRAWGDLDPPVPLRPRPEKKAAYDWQTAVNALAESPAALTALLRQVPAALDALITLSNGGDLPQASSLDLTGDAKRYIRDRLRRADPEIVGLARLADHRTLPRHLDPPTWRPIVSDTTDEAVLAVAYLIARSGRPEHWEIASLSAAALYRLLAAQPGIAAWTRLERHLHGDRESWDRCERLVTDYADVVRRYNDDTKVRALSLLSRTHPPAARALEKELRPPKSKKFNFLDPTTWL